MSSSTYLTPLCTPAPAHTPHTHFFPCTLTHLHAQKPTCTCTLHTQSPTHLYRVTHTDTTHAYSTQYTHHTPIPKQTHNITFTLLCCSLRKVSLCCDCVALAPVPSSLHAHELAGERHWFLGQVGSWFPTPGPYVGSGTEALLRACLLGSRSQSSLR